jgi:hypothetical protein
MHPGHMAGVPSLTKKAHLTNQLKNRSREPFYRKAAKSAKDLQQKQESSVW